MCLLTIALYAFLSSDFIALGTKFLPVSKTMTGFFLNCIMFTLTYLVGNLQPYISLFWWENSKSLINLALDSLFLHIVFAIFTYFLLIDHLFTRLFSPLFLPVIFQLLSYNLLNFLTLQSLYLPKGNILDNIIQQEIKLT